MNSSMMATIWLVLAIGYNQQIGGEPRPCTGRANIKHAALLRADKPNGKTWLLLCEDLQSWMAYPWPRTRAKLERSMRQPWFFGEQNFNEPGMIDNNYGFWIARGKH